MINLKFSKLPVYEHKINYGILKTELAEIQGLPELLDFENDNDNDTCIYCEFFYGYRMMKNHYLNLDGIISGLKSLVNSYADYHDLSVYKLNYSESICGLKKTPTSILNDEIFDIGTAVIDEKKRMYSKPFDNFKKVYKTSYRIIHYLVFNTIKNNKNVFKPGNNVYDNVIEKKLTDNLLHDDDLINGVINDKEFISVIENEKSIYNVNGLFFIG